MKLKLLVLLMSYCAMTVSVSAQQLGYPLSYMGGYNHLMPPKVPVRPVRMTPVEEAGVVLKAGLDKLMRFFNRGEVPTKKQIELFLGKEIAPYFDFTYMAKWTAGPRYSQLSLTQKQEIETLIQTQFLTSMAQKLSQFNHQKIRYLVPRQTGRNQVVLSIALANQSFYPARLDFRLYKGHHGWKVFDVSANGSSALMYYRQYFLRHMKRKMMAAQLNHHSG